MCAALLTAWKSATARLRYWQNPATAWMLNFENSQDIVVYGAVGENWYNKEQIHMNRVSACTDCTIFNLNTRAVREPEYGGEATLGVADQLPAPPPRPPRPTPPWAPTPLFLVVEPLRNGDGRRPRDVHDGRRPHDPESRGHRLLCELQHRHLWPWRYATHTAAVKSCATIDPVEV
jgi:hypothetical protein